VVTAWIATLLTKRTWRELFSSALPRAAFVPGAVIMALGTAIVCSEIYNITQSLIPMPAFIEKLFETLFDVKASPIGGAVALVVVAPIAEEIVCRRWILE